MKEWGALTVIVVAVASCTVGVSYTRNNEHPGTACVRAAWTHNDRLECVKAGIALSSSQAPKSQP